MRIKYKTRKTLTQIGSILLVCLIAFGAIMGAVAISKKLNEDTKIIHPQFEVGGLNAVGEYEDTDKTIYTKESFECLGLEVKLDFDSNVKYQAYFYDDLDKFVSCSAVYDESMALTVPANVTHARLVVEPIWDDDVESEDRVCHWYNVYKYANQLEISVLKDQSVAEPEQIDVVFTVGYFYDATTTLPTEAGTAQSKFAVTNSFTEDTLPVGSYIEVAEGYLMRSVRWADNSTLKEGYDDKVEGPITIDIDDDFWNNYTIAMFNIETADGHTITADECKTALKIYVPVKD